MFRNRPLLAVLVLTLVAACTPPADPGAESEVDMQETRIKGSLAYRERIALPPGSIARVTLNDTSIADTAAPAIASADIELGERQVPVPFELTVPAEKLAPNRQYAVRGTISGPDGSLLWTTDTAHTIDAGEASIDLGTLMLVRARPAAQSVQSQGRAKRQSSPPAATNPAGR